MGCREDDSGRNVVCFVGVVRCLRGPAGYCRHISALRRAKLGRNESVTDETVRMSLGLVFAPVRIVSTALLLLKMGINYNMQGGLEKGSALLHNYLGSVMVVWTLKMEL